MNKRIYIFCLRFLAEQRNKENMKTGSSVSLQEILSH